MKEPKPVTKSQIDAILNSYFWPESLQPNVNYCRTQDDCDGDFTQQVAVMFDSQGDAYLQAIGKYGFSGSLRFRMPMQGGGLSPRTRNALLILAIAIDEDNKQYPFNEEARGPGNNDNIGRKRISDMVQEVQLIDELRKEEGSSVEIFHDNPKAETKDFQCAIAAIGRWTQWEITTYYGSTVLKALQIAKALKDEMEKQK
jgi:hypothetical protein